MPKVNIEVEIPDGFEFVKFDHAKFGELYYDPGLHTKYLNGPVQGPWEHSRASYGKFVILKKIEKPTTFPQILNFHPPENTDYKFYDRILVLPKYGTYEELWHKDNKGNWQNNGYFCHIEDIVSWTPFPKMFPPMPTIKSNGVISYS